MNPYRYILSLRIWHPSIKSDAIISNIGLVPKVSQSIGENRMTPKGKKLDGIYKITYCTFPLINSEKHDFSLYDGLTDTVNKLSHCQAYFDELNASGGKVEIFIGFFFHSNSGEELDYKILSKISSLGINLSFDLYCENEITKSS